MEKDKDKKGLDVHFGHRERMRQRFMKNGYMGMQPHEVLEMILYYVARRCDTNPLAHDLINKYGSLKAVLNAPIEQLAKEKHVGESGAMLIHMFGRNAELTAYLDLLTPTIETPEQLIRLTCDLLYGKPEEEVLLVCLDKKDKVLDCFTIRGSKNSAAIMNRELLAKVLSVGAHGIVVGHNHPSGKASPSDADLAATAGMAMSLRGVGVKLYDHIITSNEKFYSFAMNGLLKEFE